MRKTIAILLLLLGALPLFAQKQKHDPLSQVEVDKIRDLGISPDDRVKFYTKILNEHAETIKGLTNRVKSAARAQRLDQELTDLTSIMDELGANLDTYSERHSDVRKALKELSEAAPKWGRIIHALAGEPAFDLSRKEAIEAGEELADQANRLLAEQEEYFAQHKSESGQERDEPK